MKPPIPIVIAEPDDLLRELVERWLREAGYVVCLAGSDSDAVANTRLVIADISNPERAEAVVAVLRASYGAPILALSARFRRGLAGSSDAAQRLQVAKVLPKPFTREELLTAVRETMAA